MIDFFLHFVGWIQFVAVFPPPLRCEKLIGKLVNFLFFLCNMDLGVDIILFGDKIVLVLNTDPT